MNTSRLSIRSAFNTCIYKQIILVVLFLTGITSPANADDSESALKAAFIYNFAKFTQWPETNSNDMYFTICVAGSTPVNKTIKSLHRKVIGGKPIITRSITSQNNLSGCRILFIGQATEQSQKELINACLLNSVLSVSDNQAFSKNRGIIQLVRIEQKIRFIINNDAARLANIEISSRLLSLATKVINNGGTQ